MRDRVEEEIDKGRLWRAKEILRGRLAASDYDPILFAQTADVLAAMRDDDEAGRFYLLAGRADGAAGGLARAHLARRSSMRFPQLWSEMPAAVRRVRMDAIPAATLQMLQAAGWRAHEVEKHLAGLERQRKADLARRRPAEGPVEPWQNRIGLAMGALLLVLLAVGLVGTMQLIWWGLKALLLAF